MKRLLAIGALLVCGSAWAGTDSVRIETLVAETGLSVSEIQMLTGARTPHMEYMTSYARAESRLVRALGKERAKALLSGREVQLDSGVRIRLASR
ncbi:MAG: hypothetical protein QM719_09150 [Thermomonas sp.]